MPTFNELQLDDNNSTQEPETYCAACGDILVRTAMLVCLDCLNDTCEVFDNVIEKKNKRNKKEGKNNV